MPSRLDPEAAGRETKLPMEEHKDRLKRLMNKYKGELWGGEGQVAKLAVDKAKRQYDRDILHQVPLRELISHRQQDDGETEDKTIGLSWNAAEGTLKTKIEDLKERADLFDHFAVYYALLRRGAAHAIAGLICYVTSCAWRKLYVNRLRSKLPPGYQPIALSQLEYADREFWSRVKDELASGATIRPTPGDKDEGQGREEGDAGCAVVAVAVPPQDGHCPTSGLSKRLLFDAAPANPKKRAKRAAARKRLKEDAKATREWKQNQQQ